MAAPGATFGFNNGYEGNANTISRQLISLAERMRYCIAMLDSGDGLNIAAVLAMRAQYDSSYAAFYYPWLRVLDPITQKEINLPPCGFVSGMHARNDVQQGVWKAPENEVAHLALGLENVVTDAELDVLNSAGVNGFRYVQGLGGSCVGRTYHELRPRVEVRSCAPLLRIPRVLD